VPISTEDDQEEEGINILTRDRSLIQYGVSIMDGFGKLLTALDQISRNKAEELVILPKTKEIKRVITLMAHFGLSAEEIQELISYTQNLYQYCGPQGSDIQGIIDYYPEVKSYLQFLAKLFDQPDQKPVETEDLQANFILVNLGLSEFKNLYASVNNNQGSTKIATKLTALFESNTLNEIIRLILEYKNYQPTTTHILLAHFLYLANWFVAALEDGIARQDELETEKTTKLREQLAFLNQLLSDSLLPNAPTSEA
jgi:hypothetical protein